MALSVVVLYIEVLFCYSPAKECNKVMSLLTIHGISIFNHLQKTVEKLCKFRKRCNHKQNINGIYNEKLHDNCLQQLPTLRLKTEDLRKLGNSDEKKWKAQTTA